MISDAIRDAFLKQAAACRMLGSPFTAHLSRLRAERLERGTPVADRILDWRGDPSPAGDSVPLRFAGCLHALVLERRSPELAAVYPPLAVDDDTLWSAIHAAEIKSAAFILDRLASAPQTNEVRRSGALLPGFMLLAQIFGKPLVLSEVGASAGLNLQWIDTDTNLAVAPSAIQAARSLSRPNGAAHPRRRRIFPLPPEPVAISIPSTPPIPNTACACSHTSGPIRPSGSIAPSMPWTSQHERISRSTGPMRSTGSAAALPPSIPAAPMSSSTRSPGNIFPNPCKRRATS